jgi:hypothetical protein
MGFNKRKMEDARRQEAEKEAAARRATEKQILEDADHLNTVWNERQAKRMPMLFSPTIGAAITAKPWPVESRIAPRVECLVAAGVTRLWLISPSIKKLYLDEDQYCSGEVKWSNPFGGSPQWRGRSGRCQGQTGRAARS